MKIAVTYDKGNVFQHFGHSAEVKVYEVEDNKVVSTDIVMATVEGHDAMANMLHELNVEQVICGGIGQGAADALAQVGINVWSGVEGDADQAVEAYLAGTLESAGVNCDHHDHEHEAAEEEGCGCAGGCGSCGGGCGGGAPQIRYEGPNAGKTVRTHYTGTLNDGTKFDSSYDRGEPLEFMAGVGMMIPGYDKAVVNMNVGDKVEIHLTPEEAYGEPNPDAIIEMKIADMPGTEGLNVGDHIALQNIYGQQIPVVVTAKDDVNITFDANHELAGKELNFTIELVEIVE